MVIRWFAASCVTTNVPSKFSQARGVCFVPAAWMVEADPVAPVCESA
jgi:hypothetical protein